MGCMSYGVFIYNNPCSDGNTWFNGDTVTFKTIVVGMGSNVIFGFIDNAGLFFGGCYLDEIFEKLPGGKDGNICAGYGNTFSDTLGMFLGTFFGSIL
jgi:hypothetical protein